MRFNHLGRRGFITLLGGCLAARRARAAADDARVGGER
jgi:hypothetical protein